MRGYRATVHQFVALKSLVFSKFFWLAPLLYGYVVSCAWLDVVACFNMFDMAKRRYESSKVFGSLTVQPFVHLFF